MKYCVTGVNEEGYREIIQEGFASESKAWNWGLTFQEHCNTHRSLMSEQWCEDCKQLLCNCNCD